VSNLNKVSSASIPFETLPFNLLMLKKHGLTMDDIELIKGLVLAENPEKVRCNFSIYGQIDDYKRYRNDRLRFSELYKDILDQIFNRSFQKEQTIALLEDLESAVYCDRG
jgi:hypothetical protein